MSKKNKDGVFSLLRQILAEQKKQTKILQAIESSQEHVDSNLVQLSDVTSKLTQKIEKSSKS